ncbi:MAG: hypothetical protein COT36_00075 [Parcubacteria group bacterium CG08_land_8_20_14_0_20_38_56]|nr:MAG: hypothetical protein COT36_00075 [Parcubacteria group bacterium CG08_land_8_20_14_0_20_38_56]
MTPTQVSIKSHKKDTSLDKYAGKWVAFVDEEVIAFGNTLEELDKKIKKLKFKQEPVFFLVPRKDEGPYILLWK